VRKADGSYGVVQGIEMVQQPQVMYNLTVAEAHTFFVGDGQWLVHNSCSFFGSAKKVAQLTKRAQELYPKKAGRTELHHIIPKYLGGDPKGTLIALNGSYHQLITNAFRDEWGYRQGRPTAERLQQILRTVYKKYPLPPP
jgi:hypothetical protein